MTTTPNRRLTTAEGSRPEAFGPTEWGLLAFVAVVWGASPLFIAEALESLSPALITTVRLALGAAALTLVPPVRPARVPMATKANPVPRIPRVRSETHDVVVTSEGIPPATEKGAVRAVATSSARHRTGSDP